MIPPSSRYNKPNSGDCYLLRAGFLLGLFCFNSVQFFIYLCVELNSQWPIRQPARIQNNNKTNTREKQKQSN
jgi:hypothetical protein